MTRWVLLFLLFSAPGIRLLSQDGGLTDAQKNALQEFEKFIKSKEAKSREEQVAFLGSIDGPEATTLLLTYGLTDTDQSVRAKAASALAKKENPKALLLIKEGTSSTSAEVREGCIRALSRMSTGEDLSPLIAQTLARESKPHVQIAALDALSRWKSKNGVETAVKLLTSKDLSVLNAAIRMIGRSGDKTGGLALHTLLQHKEWAVQSTVLESLAQLRMKESIPPILELFTAVKGRLRSDCRECLVAITGNQYGFRPEQWQEWWDRLGATWQVPEKVVNPDNDRGGYAAPDSTGYHSIKTYSKKLLFVIDVSSSMGEKIRWQEENGSFTTARRIDIAKKELIKTVKSLDQYTDFNIITFEAVIDTFKPQPVRAGAGSIDEAVRWIEKLKPYEVDISAEYTEEGYKRGQTNTFAILKHIFGRTSKGLSFYGKLKPPSDTVFLLSDGEPTCGEVTVIEDILEQVRVHHAAAPVVIHTISYDLTGVGRQMLADIARMTGGKSVVLGSK